MGLMGAAFIDQLRAKADAMRLAAKFAYADEYDLLADAVEEADESTSTSIESYCRPVEGWWDTSAADPSEMREIVDWSLSYLHRRGLIERKPGAPHLVRFIEP